MATATPKAPRTRNQLITALAHPGLKHAEKVYATATGLRIGTAGKLYRPADLLGILNKGQARQVRKALRAVGRAGWAGLAATPVPF